jgi:hypothetical protein
MIIYKGLKCKACETWGQVFLNWPTSSDDKDKTVYKDYGFLWIIQMAYSNGF